jgi:N-acetylneuraminic acid mutarotase
MNHTLKIAIILLIISGNLFSQSVEINGNLKVTNVGINNTANAVIVQNINGTFEKRDASTLGSIPSTAILLSETESNTFLTNADFVNTGYMNLSIFPKSNGVVNYGEWVGAASLMNAPERRQYHTAVWTGSEMIVWGGSNQEGIYLNTGGRYNPSTNSWTNISLANAPEIRHQHTAVWTGTEVIIWGGLTSSQSFTNTGSKYNPATNTWTTISISNAPTARYGHTAIWSGTDMIVWGGYDGTSYVNSGSKYDPLSDSWVSLSTTSAPVGRSGHSEVWTGTEMIIWGGSNVSGALSSGGKYNPITDVWTATSITSVPSARLAHVAVWSGSEMIIWGGYTGSTYFNTGGKYNPITDLWVPTSTINAPEGRYHAKSVWTGTEMIAWGGGRNSGTLFYNTGGKYNPISNSWLATPMLNVPLTRRFFSSVWTDSEMIVWGGFSSIGNLTDTGGRLNPNLPGYAPQEVVTRFLFKKNE